MAEHNGYANYETWSVISTIDNTESLYNFFKDWTKEIKSKTEDKNQRKSATIDLIKKTMESMMPKTNNPIWAPLINAVMADHVNFGEIADSLLEEW